MNINVRKAAPIAAQVAGGVLLATLVAATPALAQVGGLDGVEDAATELRGTIRNITFVIAGIFGICILIAWSQGWADLKKVAVWAFGVIGAAFAVNFVTWAATLGS